MVHIEADNSVNQFYDEISVIAFSNWKFTRQKNILAIIKVNRFEDFLKKRIIFPSNWGWESIFT